VSGVGAGAGDVRRLVVRRVVRARVGGGVGVVAFGVVGVVGGVGVGVVSGAG
jgi:hypothetical protein